jgi:hypothetical protein
MLLSFLLLAAASPEPRRIEDFRQDLAAIEIANGREIRARALAQDAYIWGLPAFLHYRQATEFKLARRMVAPAEEPFGGWLLVRDIATPKTDNALPNVDTLYGAAYVHLGKQGPVVLRVPAIAGRYFSVTLLDSYFNNFEVIGTRTVGERATNVLIVPPGWSGETPAGIDRVIFSPTPMMAALQRIYVGSPDEVPAVRRLQDQIRLEPAGGGAFPRIETPEFDVQSPVRQTRDPIAYFGLVNTYTGLNPPMQDYAASMAAIAEAGLGPGRTLPRDPAMIAALRTGAAEAQRLIDADISAGPFRNGWRLPDPRGGVPGPYALVQAVLQISQIGSLPIDEAAYFVGRRDANAALLKGRTGYTLSFPAGALPPAGSKGFWSLTLYKASDNLLYDNPINRYAIRPSTVGLTPERDGSLLLHIGHAKPSGAPAGNWLPAPEDGFLLAIRVYLPEAAARTGQWVPPALISQD